MKTLLTIAIVFLVITNAHAGTFYDDFEDGIEKLWVKRGAEGEWIVEHGELSGRWLDGMAMTYFFRGWMGTWGNYLVRVKLKVVEWKSLRDLGEVVIGVRQLWNKERNRMDGVFLILTRQNAVGLYSRFGDALSTKTGRKVNLTFNDWYNVKLIVKDNLVKAYLNEEYIGVWTDDLGQLKLFPMSLRGGVSLGVFYAHAHFDNLIISGANVPHTGRIVSQQGKITTSWGNIKDDTRRNVNQ